MKAIQLSLWDNIPTPTPTLEVIDDFMSENEFEDCCSRCDLKGICDKDECGKKLYELDEPEYNYSDFMAWVESPFDV